MSRINFRIIRKCFQQSVQTVYDCRGASLRKISSSHRPTENSISAEQNSFIFQIIGKTNPQLVADLKSGIITPEEAAISYDYTAPLVMLACLGGAALILGFVLKAVDKKKGLGLELPNIQK